jgi:citrate lyase subunit beta/citryl-CoA lyase
MRSVFYTPSNNEKMVAKAPEIACDILTLDLEDSVPPAEKQRGREMIQEYLKSGREKQLSPTLYVRVNNWETQMTNDDLEAIVHPGLDGVCLAKCGDAENVKRLDWKLEELEQRRGIEVGSVGIQLLIETAKGVMNAYPAACASPRVNSLIFGAVDFTKDMRVTLTSEGQEQLYARYHTAVAARAAGCIAIDCPFVDISDAEIGRRESKRYLKKRVLPRVRLLFHIKEKWWTPRFMKMPCRFCGPWKRSRPPMPKPKIYPQFIRLGK